MSSSLKTPLEPLAFLLIMNEYKERLQRQLDSVSLKKGDDDGKMEKAALSYSILISLPSSCLSVHWPAQWRLSPGFPAPS